MVRFALDEDFPDTIINALGIGIPEADLVPIRRIDPRLRQMDDWKLLLALHHLREWDGMVTTDSSMLKLPRELAVILQTKLTLVVVEESGHDPIRAAGLLLVHLPMICRKTVRTIGQIWRLNALSRNHEDPMKEIQKVAQHLSLSANELFYAHRLSSQELRRNPLDDFDR